ncbi:MAG: divalent metal cation transporter [Thermoplasmatales archaeon]|nr:MAG: divalent metal cation transporter [Thermoplasmatales archaeon]
MSHMIRVRNIFKFFGPAWLVMIADMDASSTLGAAEMGAIFKYGLIWFTVVLVIPLYLVQESSGRIGVATEMGLGEVIRNNYSHSLALIATVPMVLTDIVTYVIEYLGIAVGLSLFNIPILFSLPVFYVIHIAVVIHRKYGITESVLLVISGMLIVAFIAALTVRGIEPYSPLYFVPSPTFLFMLAVNVGAVIMPFMLFFQASATAEKVIHTRKKFQINNSTDINSNIERDKFTKTAMKSMRLETLLGAVVSEMLMVVVEMVMSGIGPNMNFASISQLAGGLTAIAGVYSPYLFGIGLIGAAFLALVVISMGSAWGFMEALGIGRERSSLIYIMESLPAVIIALILPKSYLISSVLYLLVIFVFVLIGPGVLMGMIARNRNIMREYSSSGIREMAYWSSLIFVLIFGIIAII